MAVGSSSTAAGSMPALRRFLQASLRGQNARRQRRPATAGKTRLHEARKVLQRGLWSVELRRQVCAIQPSPGAGRKGGIRCCSLQNLEATRRRMPSPTRSSPLASRLVPPPSRGLQWRKRNLFCRLRRLTQRAVPILSPERRHESTCELGPAGSGSRYVLQTEGEYSGW